MERFGTTTACRAGMALWGFTLVEVLVAVSLLVMIILVASYIFETTIKAVGLTQGNNELNVNSATFYETMRADLLGAEHDGIMILGRRQRQAFGSPKDRANEMKQAFRLDWIELLGGTEQYSAVDPRLIGSWSRILYGHGTVSDPASSSASNVATDWVLMRHQVLQVNRMAMSIWDVETTNYGPYSGKGVFEGVEWPNSGDYIGTGRPYRRAVLSHACRDLRWFWFMNYGWVGSVLTPDYDFPAYGGGTTLGRAYFEPDYYHTASFYSSSTLKRFHLLGHCAEFKVQFAMDEDLRAGAGGTIRWRDPPAAGDSGYYDPNFRSGVSDPAHPSQTIPTGGDNAGRLVFAPGDRWPAMLKIAVTVFDPLDRFDGGRRTEVVVPVP